MKNILVKSALLTKDSVCVGIEASQAYLVSNRRQNKTIRAIVIVLRSHVRDLLVGYR